MTLTVLSAMQVSTLKF